MTTSENTALFICNSKNTYRSFTDLTFHSATQKWAIPGRKPGFFGLIKWQGQLNWKKKKKVYRAMKWSSQKSSHWLSLSLLVNPNEHTLNSVAFCLTVCFYPPGLKIIFFVKMKLWIESNPGLPLTKWTVCRKRVMWRVILCQNPEAITCRFGSDW